MKTAARLIPLLLLIGCVVYAQTQQDPPCLYNSPPPAHYRTEIAPDGSTLRIVGVWVDPTIDSSNFSEGVSLAINNWNNQRDSSGRDLPYRFERVNDPANAGINIAGGGETCPFGCACWNWNTRTIRTEATVRDNTPESIAGIVGHEFGHPMGLQTLERPSFPQASCRALRATVKGLPAPRSRTTWSRLIGMRLTGQLVQSQLI